DAVVGGYRRDGVAGGWRGHHEPDSALPLLLWSVRAGDDPRLQGRKFSSAAGLRNHADAVWRHGGAEGDGAGRAEPVVVALFDDVRTAGRGKPAFRQFHLGDAQKFLNREMG